MLTHISRSPHGALTEDVCENVSGKGREGNKEGKGRESAGRLPTQSSLTYPRAGRDGWVVNPR